MRRREFIGTAAAFAVGSAAHAAAAFPRPSAQAVEAAARAAIAAKACPGVQVAIAQRGEIVLERGYGLADIARNAPVTKRNVFRAASLTKQFTAAVVLKLAADGRLDLNAPVARHLPFMAPLQATTALELMHQTAGLRSDETSAPLAGAPSQIDLARSIAAQSAPFDFAPGTAWLYSNANYIMLGALIEAVTQKPLARAYDDIIFRPLGLRATAMDHTGDEVRHRARGYVLDESEPPVFTPAGDIDIAQAGGAGALRSTASDLCKWHGALLSGRLLAPADLALMVAPGRLRDGRLSGANRFSENDAHYGDVQYACGLLVSPQSDPHASVMHYGFIEGYAGVLQTFLTSKTTMAVMCNAGPGPALPFRAIRQAVIAGLA